MSLPHIMPLPHSLAANPVLSHWITLNRDGRIDLRVGKAELGQGILTALAQLAADELGVPRDRITIHGPSTDGPDEGLTAGSTSMMDSGAAVRLVCANVRELVRALPGHPDGITYGDAADVLDLNRKARADVPLEPTPEGRDPSMPRLDLPDKITGVPRFLTDLRLPDQLAGRVLRPPAPGARLLSASAPPDVHVVRDGSFLGVVAETETAADHAVRELRARCTWTQPTPVPRDIKAFLRAGPHETIEVAGDGGPAPHGRRVRASYHRPYLAHAAMAPSCAAARWDDDRLDVWTHSQGIYPLRAALARVVGLAEERITLRHVEHAGCYGHNGADDAALDAVLLARAVPGRPVLLRWSRHDEMRSAPLGPAMTADVQAVLDDTGRIVSWDYDVYSQGHIARPGYAGSPGLLAAAHLADPWDLPPATDPPAARGGGSTRNALPLYDLGRRRITGHRVQASPVRTSALRSLGAFLNVFAIESFMDELAASAGRDPMEYRLAHLADERARAVLARASEALRGAPAEGVGRGLGFARYKGTGAYCAVVAEVVAVDDIRVRRLTVVADAGQVVHPDGTRNQLEGGAIQATSWTLKEQATFEGEGDWETYPILRFTDVPEVEVELLARADDVPLGVGEAAQGPTAAAIANAVADALGVRVRDLPITREAVVATINQS